MSREPVLIVGGTSGIARELGLALAARGHSLLLAARDEAELQRVAADIGLRTGVDVAWMTLDVAAIETHETFFAEAQQRMGEIGGVVMCAGYLGSQAAGEADAREAATIMSSNYNGPAAFLLVAARYLEQRGSGFIIALTSVAGDRGRKSNYLYGSAKGGLTIFLQGLRARLVSAGVRVLTVKPGPTDTAMTFGMSKLPMMVQPSVIADGVLKALDKGKDVVYIPGPWRLIMFILRSIPESVFKKLNL